MVGEVLFGGRGGWIVGLLVEQRDDDNGNRGEDIDDAKGCRGT
jgi:hypothetical protein